MVFAGSGFTVTDSTVLCSLSDNPLGILKRICENESTKKRIMCLTALCSWFGFACLIASYMLNLMLCYLKSKIYVKDWGPLLMETVY